jgi:hypothetical protein
VARRTAPSGSEGETQVIHILDTDVFTVAELHDSPFDGLLVFVPLLSHLYLVDFR